MITFRCRAWAQSAAFVLIATLVHAHPGHDGHEVTWDFRHLAQHPLATMSCAALLGTALAVMYRLTRRPGTPHI